MTVSRVINKAKVGSVKRFAVENAIRSLKYFPDPSAQAMRTGKTKRIAFVLPDITNQTNAIVVQAAEKILASHGYDSSIFCSNFAPDKDYEVLQMAKNKSFDGLIMALADETNASVAGAINNLGLPVVIIDRDLDAKCDFVIRHHSESVTQVVNNLVSLKHKRIALIAPSKRTRPGNIRIAAFVEAIKARGLTVDESMIYCENQSTDYGYQSAYALLTRPDPPTALITGANQLMIGAFSAIRDLDISVPEDLSFVGSDELLLSSLWEPPITVIWSDLNDVGEAAANLLISRLTGDISPQKIVRIRSEIAMRQSVGPAPDTIDK